MFLPLSDKLHVEICCEHGLAILKEEGRIRLKINKLKNKTTTTLYKMHDPNIPIRHSSLYSNYLLGIPESQIFQQKITTYIPNRATAQNTYARLSWLCSAMLPSTNIKLAMGFIHMLINLVSVCASSLSEFSCNCLWACDVCRILLTFSVRWKAFTSAYFELGSYFAWV